MITHRYILQPYKSPSCRYACPQCGAAKRFKRYIDTQTNTPLAHHVGRCDRAAKCGYHYTPRQYFAANPNEKPPIAKPQKPQWLQPHSTIPNALMQQTLGRYNNNAFVIYLYDLFEEDPDARERVTEDYRIGTSKHWPGANIFWQIDIKGKVRTGKIMLYDVATCKRVKHPYNHIAWVHKVMQNSKVKNQNKSEIEHPTSEFILRQCLFGEHLLNKYPDKIVALVESEKTAIIAAGKMPEYVWLAAGSLQGINAEKCKVLQGRNVMLFPDLDGYDKWQAKANELNAKMPTTNFKVSNYLRQHSLAQFSYPGMDLADLFIDDWERTKFLYKEWGLRE